MSSASENAVGKERPMANASTKSWLEKEKSYFTYSILALLGGLFVTQSEAFSILGQPYNWKISLWLFIFCTLFRIKNHFAELRLTEFYNDFSQHLTDRGKSIEQITDEVYLCLSHLLCLSIIHFYTFSAIFTAYILLDQYYNKAYLKYQLKNKPKWGEDKFIPVRLFRRWVRIGHFEIIAILFTFYLIFVSRIEFSFIAYAFIAILFLVEIIIDWFRINTDFYLDYFRKET